MIEFELRVLLILSLYQNQVVGNLLGKVPR